MASSWECFWSVTVVNHVLVLVWLVFWIVIIVIDATVSLRFIAQLLELGTHNNNDKNSHSRRRQHMRAASKKSRNKFNCLICFTVFTLVVSMVGYLIMQLFRAYYRANDEIQDNDECKDGIKLTESSFDDTYFFTIVALEFATSYLSILSCYYYRLLLIFEGSVFALPKHKKIKFFVSITSAILSIILARILTVFPDLKLASNIFGRCFVVFFIFASAYLCVCLKNQFKLLLNHANTPANNSDEFRNKRMKFYVTMRRLTIVAYFSLFTTLSALVISLVAEAMFIYFGNGENVTTVVIQGSLFLLDWTVNLICIMIQFAHFPISIVYDKICKKLEKLSCYKKMEQVYNLEPQNIQVTAVSTPVE